ncbi:MAG: hypothetical protein KDC38_14535 [Planctomycetes bacterium]|nr:hypothetical protein [Planctomycetota bacterium]
MKRAAGRRVRSRSRRAGGFTLAECAIAIVILGSSVIAGLMLFETQASAYESQALESAGLGYLKRDFEWTNAIPFDALATQNWTAVPEDGRFQVGRLVTDLNTELKQIDVYIRWTTPTGVVRIESVTTVRYKGNS